jgi:peptide/nickel transport system ATP-binding protein
MTDPILVVENLRTHFLAAAAVMKAVDGVSFSVARGEVMGLVGESGSGKTITGFSLLGLIEPPGRIVEGSIRFHGQELVGLPQSELRKIRGKRIAMVFQDPMMTLNPVLSILTQMTLAVQAHDRVSARAARERSVDVLRRVGIPNAEERINAFPHQFSGGMRQRVAIAIALLHGADLIVADEPTTALDVSIQAQILAEMKKLVTELGTAMIWISHDLATVSSICDTLAVMYGGRIVESGKTTDVLSHPRHPYTAGLLASIPALAEPGAMLHPIRGAPPSVANLPQGCSFRPRCDRVLPACFEMPALLGENDRRYRCHNPMPS